MIWSALSPVEDALVWAMRAENIPFPDIECRILARRQFSERWNDGAENRRIALAASRARVAADVAFGTCAHCRDRFRYRPSRGSRRLCLPCGKHA